MTTVKRRHVFITLIVAVAMTAGLVYYILQFRAPEATPDRRSADEVVVLIHGMGRTTASMNTLRDRLVVKGYRVENWGYASMGGTIDELGGQLSAFLADLTADDNVERIHLVGHSLGGIVARKALLDERPSKIGRVVMLAPPNSGSAVARRLTPVLGDLIKPLPELSDDPASRVNQLDVPVGIEFGVIAAESDGKVAIKDTHLKGEADHLIVPGFHSFIMNREDVADQIDYFLQNGKFEHSLEK